MQPVQKAIFPGILGSAVVLILVTRLISAPQTVVEASYDPAQDQAQQVVEEAPAAPAGECGIAGSYPAEVQQWCGWITSYAAENGVDPNLIAAVMLQESGGNPDAYSKSGAVGLMQVMPSDGIAAEFQCANGPCFASRPSMEELFNPEFNISYGARMLSGLISRNGDVREALRAYGPMDIGYRYADIVLTIYQQYQ